MQWPDTMNGIPLVSFKAPGCSPRLVCARYDPLVAYLYSLPPAVVLSRSGSNYRVEVVLRVENRAGSLMAVRNSRRSRMAQMGSRRRSTAVDEGVHSVFKKINLVATSRYIGKPTSLGCSAKSGDRLFFFLLSFFDSKHRRAQSKGPHPTGCSAEALLMLSHAHP
jgi:hypothetical protein